MTVKSKILDALGKFWTKLKTTYVTNCASTTNNLALAASQGKVLQDQINTLNSNKVSMGSNATLASITAEPAVTQYINIRVASSLGSYTLIVGQNSIGLWDNTNNVIVHRVNWDS